MLVQVFTETNEWGEFLKIKENLAVKIIEFLRIIKQDLHSQVSHYT